MDRRTYILVFYAVALVGVCGFLRIAMSGLLGVRGGSADQIHNANDVRRVRKVAPDPVFFSRKDIDKEPSSNGMIGTSRLESQESDEVVTDMHGITRRPLDISISMMKKTFPHGKDYKWYVSGPQNSGTNFVYKQFEANCPETATFEVRWKGSGEIPSFLGSKKLGKHTMIAQWGNPKDRIVQCSRQKGQKCAVLVVVRDPLVWFKSQCRQPYYGWVFPKGPSKLDKQAGAQCHHPFEITEAHLQRIHGLSPETGKPYRFETLAHAWNTFYAPFLDSDNPFQWFFLRYEDVLIHLEEVTKKVCSHFGKPIENIVTRERSAKAHTGKVSNGYSAALAKVKDTASRIKGYSAHDLKIIRDTLDKRLLSLFGYTIPKSS